jgi:hypothetical protein
MTSKRSGKGGRVTPKGTRPADTRPKVEHHEEVDRAHTSSSELDLTGGHAATQGKAPHAASLRAQGRTGHRGDR